MQSEHSFCEEVAGAPFGSPSGPAAAGVATQTSAKRDPAGAEWASNCRVDASTSSAASSGGSQRRPV